MKAKSPEGKIGEQWAKNGEKLPIVRHCRLDLTRSVRRDACSNFLLPGHGESAERANAKKDCTQVFWRKREMLRITMSVSGEGATKYFDAALATSKYYGSERGQWGGKGAELLGLRGDVARKDFIALASKKLPGTDEWRTVLMKTSRKQKGVILYKIANT